ncbi:MAG: phosphohydrolase [Aestuariibacter sp.]|nr:phosphohydrolase [Aestuariibacter sp.]|tara:strand:- start:10789 stop:11643 length:855 start_codon:yes stop_codon:yes gene_type:complete
MKPILCIYHDHCTDGYGAAWVVQRKFGVENVELYGGTYMRPAPPVELYKDRTVYLVDFSYKRDVLKKIAEQAKEVIILDHHATAEADIAPLIADGTVTGCFAKEESGALLTWNYLFAGFPAPRLIQHLSDRDLWTFKLPNTKVIVEAVMSYDYDYDTWTDLMHEPLSNLIEIGERLYAMKLKNAKDIIDSNTLLVEFEGSLVPCVNMPYQWVSDGAEFLKDDYDFVVLFTVEREHVKFSLRSAKGKTDVSEIALKYGGGGHREAASFSLAKDDYLVRRLVLGSY